MAFNLTANLNVALNTGALRAAANQLNSALNTNTQLKLGIDRNSLSGIKQVKSQIEEATNSMESFGRQAGFAAKRFAAFTLTAGSMIAFISTMKEAISAAVDFDREMIRLRQVSSDTVQDVAAVADQITNLSKSFGVSSKDLIGVAVVLKQANLSLSETKDALEAMAQAALAPNFDNLKDTTEGAIAIMKQFKVEAKDLGSALGSVNAVAGEFAVEASDIIEAIRKTGGAFKAAGGNLNELIALFTSVRQTTRESAESIGTGLRTIFTRIQRNDTANALKQVGIELRYTANEARALGDAGLENQFVGPYEAIKRLSAGLSELRSTDPRFSAIVEQLGGYRQISKVIPLIQEFATAQKALGVAQAGSVSLAVNAGQAQDALAVKLQKLKESFFEVGRSIVNSPGFRGLTDTFISAATSVLSLVNSLKGLIPLIAAISVVKIGTGIGSFAKGFFSGASSDGRPTAKKADGGFLRMRTGGIVPGSGSGDKVPALLEPGEMVIPKGMVRRQMYANKGNVKANDSTAPAVASSIANNKQVKRINIDEDQKSGKLKDLIVISLYGKEKGKLNKGDKEETNIRRTLSKAKPTKNTNDPYDNNIYEDSDIPYVIYSPNTVTNKDDIRKKIKKDAKSIIKNHKVTVSDNFEKKDNNGDNINGLIVSDFDKLSKEFGFVRAKEIATKALVNKGSSRQNQLEGYLFENYLINKTKALQEGYLQDEITNMSDDQKSKYPVDAFGTSEQISSIIGEDLTKTLNIRKGSYVELKRSAVSGDKILKKEIALYQDNYISSAQKTLRAASRGNYHLVAFGGPIPRQRFMDGEEVIHRKEFLDNSFSPGMKLKSALQYTPRIIFKRQPKEYEKFPNMDHTSPHFEQFAEMFVGSRKASQFKRVIENQRLYEEAVKNNDLELANKYEKLNKLPANIRLLAAAKAMTSSQEKARTNSFEEGNFDYEKNLLVNYSGKKTTTRHELGAHAVAYGAAKEGSPLANSLFGSIGRRMGAYGKGSGETTLISEMHAHTIQSRKQKDKIDSLREFISSEKMANLYKSEAHAALADSIKSGTEISTAGILGGRHKNIEIDVLKRMMQDAYGDNSEVLSQKMDLLNPTNSSNNVNFGALFSEAKQSRKYAYGGKVQELISGYTEEQRKKFDQKLADAKQILRNAKETGSMNLKSVGFTFLGKKFNLAQKKKEQEKANVKPLYDLKGAKSLEEFLSKIPSNYVEELKAKIGRAQDKFISTKNIKDLKFAYDFGDRRGPLNIQLEKDLIKFGSIASFPWKPKTPKEKRAEALRIATEKNVVKKRVRKSLAEERRSKAETTSSLNELISSIEKENKEESIYQIARPTKVFEGSEQYKEIQRKLALTREEINREKRMSLVGSTNYNIEDVNRKIVAGEGQQNLVAGKSVFTGQRILIEGEVPLDSKYRSSRSGIFVDNLGVKENISNAIRQLNEYQFSEKGLPRSDQYLPTTTPGRKVLNEDSKRTGLPNTTGRSAFQERVFQKSQREKSIGIKEDYSSGYNPTQAEERELEKSEYYGIAKNQKTKKEKRRKKTEGEKYNLLRRQSAPTQERTLFDESQLSNIGTYGVNEPEGASTTKLFGKQLIAGTTRPEAFSPLFRLRSRAKESVVSRLILNERQLRRRIANENLEENLRSLRFAGGGLVPGTGNSDTVPMDLPEGSFVIRKSSVNKIGADNLARASKFASGGTVPALLTPGEYVYSPEEANKIGPSRLHSMNRFAKFARGGPIGLSRSGKFDANDPKDIEKLKETLEEQLRYEDPNKDEATIQIEVKQQTDEIQRRQNQYTSDEMARQADESKVTSANALVNRQQSKVNIQQDKVNLASDDVAAASKAKDKNEKEARAKAQEEAKYRSEASKQQTKIRTLTAAGAAPTDPRLVAANAALVAATNSANAAMREKNRAISAASAADVQLTKNTNILNAENAKLAQEQRMLGLAQKNAVNATNAYTASTLKAEKSAALLDEYQQDASGKVLLAGKVIGETKPLSGKGSVEDILKQKEKEYASDFKRKPGKDEREILKSDIVSQYRESVGKQLRAKAEKEGKPISEINLQASVEQYTQEFARGKRKGIFEKGQMLGDLDVGSKLERGGSYKASGELTTKGKLQDLGYRAIFGSRRTDFEAGPEGEKQFVQARGQNIANKLTTLAVGANLVGGQIKERAGTGEGIVSKGEGDTVKVNEQLASVFTSTQAFGQSISSASTYSATAAQSLAQFGPVVAGFGAGIAGIVGAFEGYHNGIKEAEAKIREAKIAQALNNLQNIFERVSNGLLEVNDSTLRRISENQAVLTQENQAKAYEESGGNASMAQVALFKLSGGLIGKDVDQAKYNESLKRSTKETEAAQLVPLTNVLNKFSQEIGKNEALRIKSTGGDLATTNFEDIRGGLLEKLRSSGGGAGREQIARIASAQDITIQDAEKQFIKTLQESFQAEKIKTITTKSIQENARAINSMEALSNAVSSAAAAADSFSSKLETNAALFEGSIGSTKLTSFSEKYGGTTPDFSVFNNAITESAGILGAYGQQFKAQGNAVNVATQILPDILANSVENPISGKDTATQITDALKEGLKQRGITGTAAEQVVSSVGGKVSAEEFTKLLAEAGGDVSKASKKLISDISGPLISAFNEIDNKLTDAGNKYISGLEELAKRQKAIGDQIGRLSELRSRSRSFMASEIQRLPGVQQGVAETINLQGARQDFSEQQQRLTGFGAGAAENPAAIASRLAKTQEQIRAQEQKVQATSKSSNAGADFRNAALELTKLKSQASNLNDALKNLTDQSKKLEAAQAKLAQVRQGIDEKRSLGRKLLTQSPEEQQKMLQGQQLLNIVKAQGGSVAGLSTEQNTVLFDFLDNFGSAGKKIADQILDVSGYGAGKEDMSQQESLVAEQARIFAVQEEAQRKIISNQQSLQEDYFSNLDSRNEKFYSELQKFIQELQKNQLISEKLGKQQEITKIKDVQKEGKFLGAAGFNTKEDFEKLNTYKGQVLDLAKSKQEEERIKKLGGVDFKGKTYDGVMQNPLELEAKLVQAGYKTSEATKVRELTQEQLNIGNQKNPVEEAIKLFKEQKLGDIYKNQSKIQTEIKGSGAEEKLNKLVNSLARNEISFEQFDRATASIKELQLAAGQGLSAAADAATGRLNELNTQINQLGGIQAPISAPVQVGGFAVGGSVFKPRGTDTVPAMLTPGEFVVNKNATQKNLPLLQSINSGKTSYLANGGMVQYYQNAGPVIQENNQTPYMQEFLQSDEYKNAIKREYLQVNSFSGDLESKAFKLQKDKKNNDYLKEQNVFFGTFRGLTSTINKAISNSDEKENISKLYNINFTTLANDFIKKRKDIKELGVYGVSNEYSYLDYFHAQATNDKLSKDNGINSFKIIKETLKNKIATKSLLNAALGNGILALAGGIPNLTPTYSEFDKFFPETKLAKKQKEVENSSEDYVDFALGIKQKDKIDYTQDVANARKQFDKRKAEERQKIIDEQQRLKNEEQGKVKKQVSEKLDTSNIIGLDRQGSIAKTKDIKAQKEEISKGKYIDKYIESGLISEVSSQNADKFIKEKGAKEDNYFLRRKGSAEAIAKIYLQREAQAQAIIGKLKLIQDNPEEDPAGITPKFAFEAGQKELKKLIDGETTSINKDSLSKISDGQKKIVSSFITMNSFENAVTSKGKDMVSLIDTYGKAITKDPQSLVEKLIKQKEKRADISGDPKFITAQAQGIFEALMFLDREGKANKLFATRGQIKKGRSILDVLEERSEKNIKSFTRFGKLKDGINDKGIGYVNFGTKDDTEVDFLTTDFRTAVPQMSYEEIINKLTENNLYPYKNGLDNKVLNLLGGKPSISNYGYLNFSSRKEDILNGLQTDGGLFKINSFPKKDEEDKTIFERQALVALLENKTTYAELSKISSEIKGKKNDISALGEEEVFGTFGVTKDGEKSQVGIQAKEVEALRNAYFAKNQDTKLFEKDLQQLSQRTKKYFKFASYASREPNDIKETNFLLSELEILKNGYNLRLKDRENFIKDEPQQEIYDKNEYATENSQIPIATAEQRKKYMEDSKKIRPIVKSNEKKQIPQNIMANIPELRNISTTEDIINKQNILGPMQGELFFDRNSNKLRTKGNEQQEEEYNIVQNYINSPSFQGIQEVESKIEQIKLNKVFDKVDDPSIYPDDGELANTIWLRGLEESLVKLKEYDSTTEAYKKFQELQRKKYIEQFIGMKNNLNFSNFSMPNVLENIKNTKAYEILKLNIDNTVIEEDGVFTIRPRNKSKGGPINYLSGGGVPSYAPNPNPSFFKPKGTDTVPAMLSPGEFVINAAATAKHGDLLHAINNGEDVGYSSTGGLIKYLDKGGNLTGINLFRKNAIKSFQKQIGYKFFNDPDKNKLKGINYVGDTGLFGEGPKEGGGYYTEQKNVELKNIEEKQPEKKEPRKFTIPIPPPINQGGNNGGGGGGASSQPPPIKKEEKSVGEIEQLKLKMAELQAQQDAMAAEELTYNKGGIIKSRTDTIPAMLTPGEFVVNAKSSAKNSSLLHAINSGKEIDGFAQGGVVGYYAGGKTSGGRPSDRFNVAANMFSQSVSRFDSVLSKINAPTNSGYISIAKSSFDELSRILKTEIKVSSEPIRDFDRAVNNFGQNTTGFINNFGSSLEKFKGYINELNTVINTIPSTINLEVVGNLSASLNVDFNTQSVFLAVTNAVESLKGFIVSEIDKQINNEMF